MKIDEMNRTVLYLIDTRSRFCELGAWSPTQTESGDLILRRIMSFGPLWSKELPNHLSLSGGLLAVTADGYSAMSSAGFTSTFGDGWRHKNVAAVIDTDVEQWTNDRVAKTIVKAFPIRLFPEGSLLVKPRKQPIAANVNVTEAAHLVFSTKEALSRNTSNHRWYIAEGQSNDFQYAEISWQPPEDDREVYGCSSGPTPIKFSPEHKESLVSLRVGKNEDGRLWTFRPEKEE